MRGRTVTAAVLAVLLAAGLLSRAPAFACTCVEQSVAQHFEAAGQVFIGTVMVVEERAQRTVTTFSLHEILKGRLPRSVDVLTERFDSCGVAFVSGTRYVVFAEDDADGGALRTDACSGTTDDATVRSEARALGRGGVLETAAGEPAVADESIGSRAGSIAAAGLVLAGMLVALAVYARRRVFTTGDPR